MSDHPIIKEIEENIRKLFKSKPSLKNVLSILSENKIRYGIFAGACVSLLTSNREATDVDILVFDDDFKKLSDLFEGVVKKREEIKLIGDFYYLSDNKDIEFVSKLNFRDKEKSYPIRLTPLAWEHTYKYIVDGVEIVLLDPVDTILEKAILPRGKEVGKHDLEDIQALANVVDIDKVYLLKRIKETKVDEEVTNLLHKYNII